MRMLKWKNGRRKGIRANLVCECRPADLDVCLYAFTRLSAHSHYEVDEQIRLKISAKV